MSSVSGGANSLWLTEWLTTALDLRPGMRVLDLGCGRGASSIFLRREFGVQVWATDLWFDASERMERIRDAGVDDGVFPIHADARSLPFAAGFFDAIVSIDSFFYYGTDDFYLNYLVRFLKPGGPIGIAGAGMMQEIDGALPVISRDWWTQDCWALHSAAWWRRHWERTGILEIELADTMPEGWQFWLDWHKAIAPDNAEEIKALEADRGRYFGYVRIVGRRRGGTALGEHTLSVQTEYEEDAPAAGRGVASDLAETERRTSSFPRQASRPRRLGSAARSSWRSVLGQKDEGAWSIPKGEFSDGEERLAAARREFEEEMGRPVEGEFLPLEPIRQAGGKHVLAWGVRADFDPTTLRSNTFSMEWPPQSGRQQQFPEVDRAAWFDLDVANRRS